PPAFTAATEVGVELLANGKVVDSQVLSFAPNTQTSQQSLSLEANLTLTANELVEVQAAALSGSAQFPGPSSSSSQYLRLIQFNDFPGSGPAVASQASPPAPGPGLASPFAVFTFLVKQGKHWYLQIWNSDPADPFLGWLLLEGLSKKQARSLGLPNAATPVFLFLPSGGVSLFA